jgi:IclR family transcriptional regulator, pca regulon regulatory protein
VNSALSLQAFTPHRPTLGITEIAGDLGLTRSTTRRYVATLASLGYLQQDPATRKYRRGARVLDLGFAVLGSLELREIAAPHLRRLTDTTGHTSNLAMRDDIDRDPHRPGPRQAGPLPPPGVQPARRLPAACLLQRDRQGAAGVPAARRAGPAA